MDDIRAFESKWADLTQNAEFLGNALRDIKIDVSASFNAPQGPIACVQNPTLKRTRSEPEENALQSLRRKLTLASEYVFPDIDPSELGNFDRRRTQIKIAQLDHKGGKWAEIRLGDGIRQTMVRRARHPSHLRALPLYIRP